MDTGESHESPFGRTELETEQALEFCEDIKAAAELAELSLKLENLSQRAANKVIHQTFLGRIPYELDVAIAPGSEAYVVHDDDIIDTEPQRFTATEVWSIGKFGVEFYNRITRQGLKLTGYDFEVSPVFKDEGEASEFPEYRTEFESDEEAQAYVDSLLKGSWTAEGVGLWWARPRPQLGNLAPRQAWPHNRQAVIDLAYGGMGQQAT